MLHRILISCKYILSSCLVFLHVEQTITHPSHSLLEVEDLFHSFSIFEMQFKTIALAIAAATSALALPGYGSTVPGYPWGFGFCLSDQQANWVVQQYKSILTNNNRAAAVQTANQLLDNNYQETSDSIVSIACAFLAPH